VPKAIPDAQARALRAIASVLLVALPALADVAPARALTLLTEENPPFSFARDGSLHGMAADVVAEASRRSGIVATSEVVTWDRAYARAQGEPDTCMFPLARRPERTEQFRWVGPIATNAWAVFAGPAFFGTVRGIADLRPWRIGAVAGDAKAEFLRENGVTRVLAARTDRDNPARLLLPPDHPDHIDLWIAGVHGAGEVSRSVGVSDVVLVRVVREIPLYLACNLRTARETLQALSDSLATMRADGTMERLAGRYAAPSNGRPAGRP
jgi:polar amino acid transport system substrate-binding protein